MAKIEVGITTVAVWRMEPRADGNRVPTIIHEGVVVQQTSSHVRVYKHAPTDKGGDVSPESAELFPLAGKDLWCVETGRRSTPFPVPWAMLY